MRNYKAEDYPIQEEIRHTIDKKNDMLYVRSFKFRIIPKVKFLRAKDKKIFVSDTRIGSYKIDVPFTSRTEIREIWHDYTHFHNDSELEKREVEIKEYQEPLLTEFINNKTQSHTTHEPARMDFSKR